MHQDRASLYYTVDAMLKYSLGDVFDWGDWEPLLELDQDGLGKKTQIG